MRLFFLFLFICPLTVPKQMSLWKGDVRILNTVTTEDDLFYILEKADTGTFIGFVWTEEYFYRLAIKKEPRATR